MVRMALSLCTMMIRMAQMLCTMMVKIEQFMYVDGKNVTKVVFYDGLNRRIIYVFVFVIVSQGCHGCIMFAAFARTEFMNERPKLFISCTDGVMHARYNCLSFARAGTECKATICADGAMSNLPKLFVTSTYGALRDRSKLFAIFTDWALRDMLTCLSFAQIWHCGIC
ncbi:hypothetical protein DPMN_046827 [Dreissena polymorpha]|uniref:Secreted protein n=1 Tax=Dreissena polymorpha TaxID=45954 RepID=A0A9D4D7K5_DREPO|nr:hypothetical protein DPMN_046827 [Dreissena polymorpha]